MSTPLRPAPLEHRLGDIAGRCGLALADPADAQVRVTGVTLDSRAVRPGDLFAALPGDRTHGAAFIPQARDLGAVAVLTDPTGLGSAAGLPAVVHDEPRRRLGAVAALVYGDPASDLLMVGVTGTNGKTTTAYLLQAGLRAAGLRAGLIGTTGVLLEDESLPSARTTPEAPDLHALLAVMRERGIQAVAMEVSSHALVLGRVDGIVFDAAVFTNLSQDHLDFHRTMEDYFAAKASLFVPERALRGVVGVDDAWGRRLAVEATVPVTTYAIDHDADVRCVSIASDAQGQVLAVDDRGERASVRVGLPGDFNAANGLAAWTALRALGRPEHAADAGMAAVRVPGRMEIVDVGQPFLAVVDYAHSPDSVERVLSSVRPAPGGRCIVVLGCGGDRDRDKRPVMGRIAGELSDLLVVTDDNPRSEDPAAIRAAMLAGVPEGAHVLEIGDRREAIAAAVAAARPGDVLLLLGKGHEPGQEAGGVVQPFHDSDVLAAALEEHRR
ncbi:MAG: UDP-N-acetylmuramoyl-L-alanyl-D-glutamate--2,6-diaminopimelate ligase [bacterium]